MAKILGILGGMGPQATVDLMTKIIAATPVEGEADHVHMLVDCNPTVPSRVRSLAGLGPSPGPELARMARGLVSQGADVLAMPCNTAHAFLSDIAAAVDRPFLDMIELAVNEVRRRVPHVAKVGLLATRGTRASRLYHDRIEAMGWSVVDLREPEQSRLDELIGKVKLMPVAVADREETGQLITALARRGADSVVAGCTEVPLLLPEQTRLPVVDATDVLARAAVAYCTGRPVREP